jgi:hypothetical protein
MNHAGGLGRAYQHLGIRTDRHAFGFRADRYLANGRAFHHVDDGHHRIVFVGDIEELSGRIECELFGIRTGGQVAGVVAGPGVEDLYLVVVAERNEEEFTVTGDFNPARPLPGLDGCNGFHLVGVDHRDRIALFIRNIGEESKGRIERDNKREQREARDCNPAQIEHISVLQRCLRRTIDGVA